ncbi:MAG: T9SS type A sorting domain-containing protein, partial [Saprospiraceae bacterium]
SGNSSSCLQIISVLKASLDDVIFPVNWDSITGPYGSLQACGNWPKVPFILNGVEQTFTIGGVVHKDSVPNPTFTGEPFGTKCLKSAVTYTDKKILLCNNNPRTYKLIRKWRVIDHCTGRDSSRNQLITVMDTEAPVITCPADAISTPLVNGVVQPAASLVAGNQCTANWDVIAPTVIYDCSTTSWEVGFLLADASGRPPVNGQYVKKNGLTEVIGSGVGSRIINLPIGRTWIRYTVKDACDNFTHCFTEVDVIDNQPPTPVCDRNSIIAISNDGKAFAGVLTFDDGSHDNCGAITCMKIRRMDQLVAWTQIDCNNQIMFTCADINPTTPIMVELGVWDKGGLFNSCMVEAKVQDSKFPVLTIPSDMTANCTEKFDTLTRFGTATYTDNCLATITETRRGTQDECGYGIIWRIFKAVDTYGNTVVDSQKITITNLNKFNASGNDIGWPGTLTLNAACITDITPEKLASFPRYLRNIDCSRLAYRHEDLVFNFADGVCVKVLRKWTVIDWCQTNPFIAGSGEWSHTQLIMLNNIKPPDITKGCFPTDLTITQVGVCKARVTVTAEGNDDCTPADKIEWSYTIDEGNNGSIEVSNGTGKSIDREFSYGTHKITWTAKDGCKNAKTCSNVFTIQDTKKPTPYCLSETVTVVMPVAKEVTVWASGFNLGATDNCSTSSQITMSFDSLDRNRISRTFKCAELGGAAFKDFSIRVYAIDAAGNYDWCTVNIRVQDNGNSCAAPPVVSEKIALKGSVYNANDQNVQNVTIELKSDQVEFPKSLKTGVDGIYNFGQLSMYKDYSISADKNDDILNGVTTLDMVMIQRHILGLSVLDSPYKLIAADVNNSERVTAADLVELRKIILGIQNQFTNNRSWRFIDVAHRFADTQNPFPYVESMQMTKLDHDVAGLDFVAIKIGDVNGSALANANITEVSNRNVITLKTEKVSGKAGQIVEVNLSNDEIRSVLGLQMTLQFDKSIVDIIDVQSEKLQITHQNLGFGQWSEGKVNLSWNTDLPMDVKHSLIKVKVKLLKDITETSLITLERVGLQPEIYTYERDHISVSNLRIESEWRDKPGSEKFEVFQNIPNPFNATTIIGFNLPKAEIVTMKIYDVTGKMIYQTTGNFDKGYNTFNIDADALNLNGVLYYQLDTDTESATRKMIIIK